MMQIRTVNLLAALFLCLLFSPDSYAVTGILEVKSEPPGARIEIDGVDSGTTPYQNLEMPAGRHVIRAVLNHDYPPQDQEVQIDERTPQVVLFRFERSRGKFTGKEIVRSTSKYKGSVTFASVPTGALVAINGEPLNKTTPLGYTDLEVGKYTVDFQFEGRVLHAEFEVIHNETVKLIADFAAGTVINNRQTAKTEQEAAKREEAGQPEQSRQKQPRPENRQPEKQPDAVPASTKPQPAGGAPYGELVILMDVVRDGNLKFSDFFDIAFPKLPTASISGPLFPDSSSVYRSAYKDNFEYTSDAIAGTRRFTARVAFASRKQERTEGRARSSVMTVREGTYDLKLIRRRLAETFYSVEKLLDETAQEAIEIVRGSRLTVQIESHIGEDNKLNYLIKRTYQNLAKKKSPARETGTEQKQNSAKEFNFRSLPIFGGQ